MTLFRAAAYGRPALVLAILVAPAGAIAQSPRKPADVLPISAGPFQLYPLFAAVVEQTDNLFFDESDPVSATVTSVTPGLSAEVPLRSEGELYLGYALRYRDYGGADIDSNLSQFLLAGGEVALGTGFLLAFEEDYAEGVLDTNAFDEGGEVVFRGDEFASSVTRLDLSHQGLAQPRIGLAAGRESVQFSQSAQPDLYNSVYYNYEIYGDHRLGPQGGLRFGAYWSEGDLTPVAGTCDNNPALRCNDNADCGGGVCLNQDLRDERTFRVTLGTQWRLNPVSSIAADLGWGTAEFSGTFEDGSSKTRNLVGSVNYVRSVPARARLAMRVTQGVFPSVYGNNAYYVSRGMNVRLENDTRARMIVGGDLSFIRNVYPEADDRRTDDTVGGRLWLGYRFGSAVEWRVYADIDSRSSNALGASYDVRSYGAVVNLGG